MDISTFINTQPIPHQEEARLEALHKLALLDTSPEPDYDRIAQLAAYICQVPIAIIGFIDQNRHWFKSTVGLPAAFKQASRRDSFCQYTIMNSEILQVPDALADERFSHNPFVKGEPYLRFYVGMPLIVEDGLCIGTLCVFDTRPRVLTAEQKYAMQTLVASVVAQIALGQQKKEIEKEKEIVTQCLTIKSQFLANMSHELRTPLNGVLGLTHLLLTTSLSSEQKQYLHHIKTCTENLVTIFNDILDSSKIESGKVVFESYPFTFREVVTASVGLFKPKAEEKQLQLVSCLDDQIPEVVIGDSLKLSQILNNLLSNAIKFTHQGGVHLQVWVKEKNKEIVKLLFTVEDTGIGIEPEKMIAIFESFTQANNEMSRKYGGTGLGLSISKSFVEGQGGKLWVESVVDQGSLFKFELSFLLPAIDCPAQLPGKG